MNIDEIPQSFRVRLNDTAFYQNIIHSLPAIIYINQMDIPGDCNSVKNIWLNQRGYDFMKYSREEIDDMKYDFQQNIMYADDLKVGPISYEWGYSDLPVLFFVGMYRIKPKNDTKYHWMYGQSIIIEYHEDGSPKVFLNVAFEISEVMHSNNHMIDSMREIARLKNELRLSKFTQREKEILAFVARGKTDKEIAERLFISVGTAKKHRTNLIAKAEVKNTAELVAFAMECGVC
ncbi:response regulator transcription factor [Parabacteroides sp. FAFU027]|uniref:response regulator transcription factor n=1 Tax=Parabacteroides sp. FAFU027 TaxID=2922715 RepID=UPI001FAF08B4|nr:helix-turn-helix transcriptional regulator [Parabacteroides sp. FAFU027]